MTLKLKFHVYVFILLRNVLIILLYFCFFYRGGYILIPKTVEFWQGQSDRLHDRIRFRRPVPGEKPDNILLHQGENGWVYERLSP